MIAQVDLFWFVFLEKLKTPKRHFESTWPLGRRRPTVGQMGQKCKETSNLTLMSYPCLFTHIWWTWLHWSTNYDFLGSVGLQEIHMDALKPFDSKWVTLTMREVSLQNSRLLPMVRPIHIALMPNLYISGGLTKTLGARSLRNLNTFSTKT